MYISIDFIEELEKADPNALETARKHLDKSKNNSKYFSETKVDASCYKALGNLKNIESKMQEVKNLLWTIKYHSEKINEVRELLEIVTDISIKRN